MLINNQLLTYHWSRKSLHVMMGLQAVQHVKQGGRHESDFLHCAQWLGLMCHAQWLVIVSVMWLGAVSVKRGDLVNFCHTQWLGLVCHTQWLGLISVMRQFLSCRMIWSSFCLSCRMTWSSFYHAGWLGPVSVMQDDLVQFLSCRMTWSSFYHAGWLGPVSVTQDDLVQCLSRRMIWSSVCHAGWFGPVSVTQDDLVQCLSWSSFCHAEWLGPVSGLESLRVFSSMLRILGAFSFSLISRSK